MLAKQLEEVKCPLCGSVCCYNTEKKFWACPDCSTEVWPPADGRRKAWSWGRGTAKKKSGSRRRSRYGGKKKVKWVPWYQRGLR